MTLVDIIAWLLLPAAVLPIVTAFVLRKYRHAESPSLRDRWHVALVMAAVGVMAAVLAANRVWGLELRGEIIAIPLGVVLLAVDVVSGKWLLDYWRGAFR